MLHQPMAHTNQGTGSLTEASQTLSFLCWTLKVLEEPFAPGIRTLRNLGCLDSWRERIEHEWLGHTWSTRVLLRNKVADIGSQRELDPILPVNGLEPNLEMCRCPTWLDGIRRSSLPHRTVLRRHHMYGFCNL